MKDDLHLVLGGHGAIGRAVIKELLFQKIPVKAVERSKEAPGAETIKADLLELKQAASAVQGASHVYLCIGLPYKTPVWTEQWPKIMENVIAACEKADSKLIFFDNVYMYGPPPLAVPFDEAHPQEPQSRKGKD